MEFAGERPDCSGPSTRHRRVHGSEVPSRLIRRALHRRPRERGCRLLRCACRQTEVWREICFACSFPSNAIEFLWHCAMLRFDFFCSEAVQWYASLGAFALSHGVSVSVISLKGRGNECRLDDLAQVVSTTGGEQTESSDVYVSFLFLVALSPFFFPGFTFLFALFRRLKKTRQEPEQSRTGYRAEQDGNE